MLTRLTTVGELAFGKSFGLCEAGKDNQGFLPMLVSFTFAACLAGTQAWMGSFMLLYSRFKWRGEVVRRLATRLGADLLSAARGAGALRERAIECVNTRVDQMNDAARNGDEQRQDML